MAQVKRPVAEKRKSAPARSAAPEAPVILTGVRGITAQFGARSPKETIAWQCNNPGNITFVASIPWKGLVGEYLGLNVYDTAPNGWRSLYLNLRAYHENHGLETVEEVITRWAPPHENDTASYIAFVKRRLLQSRGLDLDPTSESFARAFVTIDFYDYEDMYALGSAIAFRESGNVWPRAVIDRGLLEAGIEPPARPSRTLAVAKVAGPATAVAAGVNAAGNLVDSDPVSVLVDQGYTWLEPLVHTVSWVAPALGVLALCGIGYMAYARLDDRRRGLRP